MLAHATLPRAVEVAARIVSCHVSRSDTKAEDLPGILSNVYGALKEIERRETSSNLDDRSSLDASGSDTAPTPEGIAVGDGEDDRLAGYVRDGRPTVDGDGIVCLDDGRKVTFLGRHLRAHGTSEDDYRRRWNLPDDYPMTAPSYVARQRETARRTGLGTRIRPSAKSSPVRRRGGTLSPVYA